MTLVREGDSANNGAGSCIGIISSGYLGRTAHSRDDPADPRRELEARLRRIWSRDIHMAASKVLVLRDAVLEEVKGLLHGSCALEHGSPSCHTAIASQLSWHTFTSNIIYAYYGKR